MKQLQIKQFTVLLDDNDYEVYKDQKFWPSIQNNDRVYFQRAGKKPYTALHRLIVNASNDTIVDHINRDTLDNRKENLRCVDKSLNAFNTRQRSDNTSGMRGVFQKTDGRKKCWFCSVQYQKKKLWLGSFYTKEDAINRIIEWRKNNLPDDIV